MSFNVNQINSEMNLKVLLYRPGNYVHFKHPNIWVLAIFGAECLRMYSCTTVRRGATAFQTFIQTETYQNVIKYHYSGTISCQVLNAVRNLCL